MKRTLLTKLNRRAQAIILLLACVIGFFAYKGVVGNEKKQELVVQTKPALLNVLIDNGQPIRAPAVFKLNSGEHKITITQEGYFTTVKNIQLAESKDRTYIDVESNELPKIVTDISSRPSTYQNYIHIGTADYMVFIDPFNRLVLSGTEENYFTMFADTIKYARNIDWLDEYRAIISTGAQFKDIKDYLVDFSPWLKNEPPTLTPLNIKAYSYTLSPDGKELAFMTTADFVNLTAKIGTIDLSTKAVSIINNFSFTAPKQLTWLDENTFMLVAERDEETNYIADTYEMQSLIKVFKDGTEWKKEILVYSLNSNVSLNKEKTTMTYAEDGRIKVVGLTNSLNKQLIPPTPIGLSLLMYNDHIILYTYPKDTNTINIGYIDIRNNTQGEAILNQNIMGKSVSIKGEGESLVGITTDRERYYVLDMGKYNFTM